MAEVREKCDICQWDDKDEVLYGDFISQGNVKVHQFCLLSSFYIPQKGNLRNKIFTT
jgi:hypothetical protein